MFKIGDFSKLGQVSTRMLRHYDKLGLLTPNHIDEWTGYRYYTIDQLGQLNRIIALKELGITLEQIGRLLNSSDRLPVDQLKGMLSMRRAELEQELQRNAQRLREVESRLLQIEQEGQPLPYEVVVKELAPQPLVSLQQIVPSVDQMGYYCESMYGRLYTHLEERGIPADGVEITVYHAEEYKEHDLDVETGIGIGDNVLATAVAAPSTDDILTFRELPAADLAAALIYEGPFREMTPAIYSLLAWIGTHNHTLAGPLRELHLSGPAHHGPGPGEIPVVELQIPIQPIN